MAVLGWWQKHGKDGNLEKKGRTVAFSGRAMQEDLTENQIPFFCENAHSVVFRCLHLGIP